MSIENESELYEIVELDSGEVALCKVDGEGEPLVAIRFSNDSLGLLSESKFEVAKAMLEAGLDAVSDLSAETVVEDELSSNRVLH